MPRAKAGERLPRIHRAVVERHAAHAHRHANRDGAALRAPLEPQPANEANKGRGEEWRHYAPGKHELEKEHVLEMARDGQSHQSAVAEVVAASLALADRVLAEQTEERLGDRVDGRGEDRLTSATPE